MIQNMILQYVTWSKNMIQYLIYTSTIDTPTSSYAVFILANKKLFIAIYIDDLLFCNLNITCRVSM